jgi:hypothetical protein
MSGRLIKVIDGVLHVAYERVAGPGYVIYVSDGVSAEGWTYYPDDLDPDDFAQTWKQPVGSEDAYAAGSVVSHNGSAWVSTTNYNVWAPGVSGWVPSTDGVPTWIQPTGAHDAYQEGAIVEHNGQSWKSMTPANVWEPGVSGWRAAVLMPPSGAPVYPAWVQPTGAHDAYQIGDKVTHNAQVWTSTINANVWEPSIYGWLAD